MCVRARCVATHTRAPFCFGKDENVTFIFIETLVDVWRPEGGGAFVHLASELLKSCDRDGK